MLPKDQWEITRNQIPVVNLLVPLYLSSQSFGLIAVKKKGRVLLPGAYIESGKDWRDICIDVCRYELRVRMPWGAYFWPVDCFTSVHKSVFILFVQSFPVKKEDLLRWKRKESTRVVVTSRTQEMAFQYHGEMVQRFFSGGR